MRYRITGSYLDLFTLVILINFLGACLATCDISVKLFDYTGAPVANVTTGQPFQLQVIVAGDDAEVGQIDFANNFASCNLKSAGVTKTINNINGVVNRYVVHKYWARLDTPGKYQLGPINIWQGLDLLGKQDIELVVKDEVRPVITRMQVKKSPIAELVVNKPVVYIGEQFVATIRLYFSALKITAAKLDFITDLSSNFDVGVIGDPKVGFEVINQEPVDYLEWQLNMSAKTAGNLIIPVIGVVFEQAGRFSSGLLFGNYQQIERLANTAKLVVKNLPPTKQAVQAVGEFNDFIAQIDQAELKDGQVAQLNLILVSKLVNAINFNTISAPNLVLPANLQAYAGSVQTQADRKTFEFVLQGIKAGNSVIPAQSFFYFDPVVEQYKTLQTKPITINILSVPDIKNNTKNTVVQNKLDQNQLAQNQAPDKFGLDPIISTGAIRYIPVFALPVRLFIFLALIPGLLVFGQARFKLIKEKFSKNKNNFKLFEKQLANLAQQQNQALLYNLFGQILVQKFKLLPTDLNKLKIDQLLQAHSVPEQARVEFGVFYDQIAQAAFAGEYQANLFESARHWLKFFKKLEPAC